jgi:hypothetical protein
VPTVFGRCLQTARSSWATSSLVWATINVVGGPLKQMSVDHLAGEDRQAIAKQCGTSVDMLERNYSFAIEDLEDEGPKPAVEERVRARTLAPAGRCRQLRAARAR